MMPVAPPAFRCLHAKALNVLLTSGFKYRKEGFSDIAEMAKVHTY